MLVGTAEILVVPDTAGFETALKDESDGAFGGFRRDAEQAGADAGAGLRTGVTDEASKLESDLGDIGAAGGVNLREGVKDGSKGLEKDLSDLGAASGAGLRTGVKDEASKLETDLSDIGSAGGLGLRRGVTEETGKLADDVEKDGERGGEGLSKGLSGGLSKISNVLGATGLPLESFRTGLDKAGEAAGETEHRTSGLGGALNEVGKVALIGFAGAAAAAAAAGVDVGEKMQSAEASIAGAAGTTVKAADQIGSAFLDTGGKSEYSGVQMAQAFASVAGQLKATEGRALDAAQASQVMAAADDLATAKQIDLGTATSTVAGVMQAFQLKTSDAAHVSDVLYQASSATGQSVDTLGSQLEKVRSKLGDTSGSVGDLAGLLVDMTDRGITGRAAMAGLNSGMNTLQKTATGVATAVTDQNAAYDQMPPSLQKLADAYRNGTMTSKDFTTATQGLPPAQAALVASFTSATDAVQKAQLKFKEMGVTAFDAQGKFVGMGSIIDQLHPKFVDMTQQQQLAAASTLFGAGAARQMVAVIDAGPAAYDRATQSVNRMGAAHNAAAKQADSLHVEEKTLEAEGVDLAGRIGAVLIPILTTLGATLIKVTGFVTEHKAVLIALAAVVTGILGPAIAVFTINKMAAFGQSFSTAAGHVKSFASDVQTAVTKIMGLFGQQTAAAEEMQTKVSAATEGTSAAVSTEASEIEGSTATVDASFAGTATAAETAQAEIGTAEAATAGEVTAADATIEADNAAAAGSFASLDAAAAGGAGAAEGIGGAAAGLGLAGAATVAAPIVIGGVLASTGAGGPLKNPPQSQGGGGRMGGLSGGGAGTQSSKLPVPGVGSTAGIPSTYNVAPANEGHRHGTVPAPGHERTAHADAAQMHTDFSVFHADMATASSRGPSAKAASASPYLDQVAKFFSAAGFNRTAIAGIYGNAGQESSFNPNTPGGGFWQQISNFGQGTGGSLLHQMQVMLPQIEGIKGVLNSAASPQAAALAFENLFEKPKGTVPGAGATTPDTYPTANTPARQRYAAQAYAQLAGLPASGGAGSGSISVAGVTDAVHTASQNAAATLATERAQLAKVIAQETAETNKKIAAEKASVSGKGVSPAEKAKVAQEIADQKGALALEVAQQRASLSELTSKQSAELKTQTSDAKAGTSLLTKMLTAIHSGSVKSLQTALSSVHTAGLTRIERDLDHDHNAALATLSKELVAVHKQALAALAKAEAAAATAAYDKAATATLNQQSTDLKDTAKIQSDLIADQTKVYLDQQAENGLSGTALIAAQAQTSLDQVTQANDQAIDAAQKNVDDAAGGSALAQAQANNALAQAQATATIQEAQAQSVLDKANAAANASTAATSTAASSTTTTNAPTIILQVNGSTLGPAALMSELAWSLKTGALPVAAPAPAPLPAAA